MLPPGLLQSHAAPLPRNLRETKAIRGDFKSFWKWKPLPTSIKDKWYRVSESFCISNKRIKALGFRRVAGSALNKILTWGGDSSGKGVVALLWTSAAAHAYSGWTVEGTDKGWEGKGENFGPHWQRLEKTVPAFLPTPFQIRLKIQKPLKTASVRHTHRLLISDSLPHSLHSVLYTRL